jgi:histidine kinase
VNVRLPVRLFASYLVVIVFGSVTAYLMVRLLLPPLFDHQMGGGMMGSGPGGTARESTHAALLSAMNTALTLAALASAAVGGIVAALVTRQLLRPLTAVRTATGRIAAGDYDSRVPLPREPELAELATDVNRLAASLKATEARRTQLLGDVAHEMRTPLTALDGYVEAFLDGVFTPGPENLTAMADELRRLHRLSDDLSTLSRAEEQRLDMHPGRADLADIARDVCDRLQPQYADAEVALDVQSRAAVPVHVDVDRITQVLTNLLGNALVATPSGGTVSVSVSADRDSAVATVADSGVGFAPEENERIFERFYRSGTAQRRSTGSGVGLTIARGIARAHGGDVTASSPGPGRGATVTLTLPLAR